MEENVSTDDINIWKKAVLAHQQHRKNFDKWPYGRIVACWEDEDGNVCVMHEKGNWWHYKAIGTPEMKWW